MILSSLITPFRIYDTYSDLLKFNSDCKHVCDYELITDKTRLLPLQFQRDSSLYPVIKAWIRPICKDFYNKVVTDQQAKFNDSSVWFVTEYANIIDGNAVFGHPPLPFTYEDSRITLSTSLTVGQKYRVKVVVIEKKVTAPNTSFLYLRDSAGNLADFSSIGTHVFDFVADDTSLRLRSEITGVNDYYKVSEFAIMTINEFSEITNEDYEIDKTAFEIIKIAGGKDIITYCGSAFDSTLPCGKYYLIIKSKDASYEDEYFFSEVITIKNFVPSQSPYVFLEWYNTCDLQLVKYTGLDCNYKNRLYIDGPISKPEYPYEEEGEKDGNQRFNPTFQKLEKKQRIGIGNAPEYIIDCFNAMKLHDEIVYKEKLDEQQLMVTDSQTVYSLEVETEFVVDDCFGKVDLIVLLEENFIDTACCTPIEEAAQTCLTCAHTVVIGEYSIPVGFALILNGSTGKLELWEYDGDEWVLADKLPDEWPVICVGERKYFYDFNQLQYAAIPTIYNLTNVGITGFTIDGFTVPGTIIEIELVYDGNTIILGNYYDDVQFAAGITINYADIPLTLILCEVLTVRVRAFNAFCPYGWSDADTTVPLSGPEC